MDGMYTIMRWCNKGLKTVKQYINSNRMCWGANIERMDRLPVLLQSLQINMPRVVPQHKHTTS